MQKNRRTSNRQHTMGLLSSLWDGESVCIGVVEDLSANGIRLSQIPFRFDKYSQECLTVVHGPFDDFKVILKPCWRLETRKEMYQLIGFKLVIPAGNWKQFVDATLKVSGAVNISP